MSELIDRQAALDALDKRFDNIPMEQTAEILMLRKDLRKLPTVQPELDLENLVRTIENGITATNSRDAYSLGMRNGMRWCKSLIDGVEPKFEGMEGADT